MNSEQIDRLRQLKERNEDPLDADAIPETCPKCGAEQIGTSGTYYCASGQRKRSDICRLTVANRLLAECAAMLKRVEYSDEGHYCPVCQKGQRVADTPSPHESWCELAAVLAKLREAIWEIRL